MPNQENIIKPARLSWDDSGNPYSEDYQDIYYAKADALAESSYIFLAANNLAERWQQLSNKNFIIGECGFGGGLNFLNTCKLWCEIFKKNSTNSTLYYLTCDLHPFTKDDLTYLHQKYPELGTYSDALLKIYPPLLSGIHSRDLNFGDKKVVLIFMLGNATEMFEQIYQANGFRVDAWYLDGFSPLLNSNMWDKLLCSALAALSKAETTLSTYSAAGLVKKSLRRNGFTIERKTGFANKRHMLVGKYNPIDQQNNSRQPAWFHIPNINQDDKRAIIIGAGLAGCSTASELAQTGWQVTLIEREPKIANKASGNPKGIVYCKLSNSTDAIANYYLHSFLFAVDHYEQFSKSNDIGWQSCGLVQIAFDEREKKRQIQAINKLSNLSFVRHLNSQEVNKISGVNIDNEGLFFPYSGFLNPRALCNAYTQHNNISCLTNTEALNLNFKNNIWQVEDSSANIVQAPIVIIANSHDASNFQQSRHYPLTKSFGQIDQYPVTELNSSLNCVVCGKGYVLPGSSDSQFIGGITNTDKALATNIRAVAEKNLELVKSMSPSLAKDYGKNVLTKSRTGVRCSSPDYLPLIGPVENKEQCQDIYAGLSRNAKKDFTQMAEHQTGLFINVAHGSHGLSSTPVAAKYLTNLINKSPLPLSNANANCLHPIRYLISNLKKQLL
ncbi:MAG: bifunctional tRNA (5-methylaminomethyl-2-thiouridine)(34)-methyltransferase MnmD/FAD-dependent 5-carboxymethylaminomethyl-2-thiouridine(34) oxidoreductase MnmC [Gammaproteobacteria bacterium]|nr:bifunctional tRNA (5-methylaminomethyl-2-thiouridine)(34)-methyltransferase MnmD/FAD-dependent 5-carboxymethylaminomethyl-2-thiouridine(34) oxidoreductase MnmC [Gammaproteobacteria bacterium]